MSTVNTQVSDYVDESLFSLLRNLSLLLIPLSLPILWWWTMYLNVTSIVVVLKRPSSASFSLFFVVSSKQYKFYNELMWKMPMQYTMLGFELNTTYPITTRPVPPLAIQLLCFANCRLVNLRLANNRWVNWHSFLPTLLVFGKHIFWSLKYRLYLECAIESK